MVRSDNEGLDGDVALKGVEWILILLVVKPSNIDYGILTAIATLFLYFDMCLSYMLYSLSCLLHPQ